MQKKKGQAKGRLMLKLTADRILSGKGNKNSEKALKHQFMHNMVMVENSSQSEAIVSSETPAEPDQASEE